MAVDWDALVLAPLHAVFGADTGTGPRVPVVLTPADGIPVPLPDAVFDRSYIVTQAEGRAPVAGFQPTLGVRAASLPPGLAPRIGDAVDVGEERFQVVDVQADNFGGVVLVLAGL